MIKCIKCFITKARDEYHNNCLTKSGKLSVCKSCRKDVQKSYRKTDLGKIRDSKYNSSDKKKEANTKYMDKFPEVKLAQTYLAHAIRSGNISKDSSCHSCSNTNNIEAHHWSYDKGDWLDVWWLCQSCHHKEHELIKVEGYPKSKVLLLDEGQIINK